MTESCQVNETLFALIMQMDMYERIMFGCDCAQRALPLYEQEFPEDIRLHRALNKARQLAAQRATVEQFTEVANDAWQCVNPGWTSRARPEDYGAATWAAVSVATALDFGADGAAHSACIAIKRSGENGQEEQWQEERAQWYVDQHKE